MKRAAYMRFSRSINSAWDFIIKLPGDPVYIVYYYIYVYIYTYTLLFKPQSRTT